MTSLGSSIENLDDTIHGRIRLGVLAFLSTAGSADFMTLVDEVGTTKGNLSRHMEKLEAAGYVRVEKTFVDRKTRTVLHMTPQGTRAFRDYLMTIRSILKVLNL